MLSYRTYKSPRGRTCKLHLCERIFNSFSTKIYLPNHCLFRVAKMSRQSFFFCLSPTIGNNGFLKIKLGRKTSCRGEKKNKENLDVRERRMTWIYIYVELHERFRCYL
jgi:hypothetical protein